ncbi:MAG: undecaprenyl-diphosphate phosphatase [Candidatus Omnitrophica bacterium]|nr:undecaprenyl-diphosphate phosphatase [Candidatus Omnitrophota bacterium]MDE2009306.1 undecaprenyl-diphosphate phosphatase [Candidatus Omnitrophota bacterium]MDE2215406.1 undecaprenyl-diphosphate phosphatase [Candidatus Omnitrophota bacterium]MDE2232281.1 undecaprenyl-diphosphate phosphatase [Candidatus Omnitrophota bacterium]
MLTIPKILVLAVIQGLTELLPVSSSAHVIIAEKFMGLDPTAPEMTLVLVMLHTGTMFAVLVYFWNSWKENFFRTKQVFWESARFLIAATIATGILGLLLKFIIEKVFLKNVPHAAVEMIFGNLLIISGGLAVVGALILCTGLKQEGPKYGPMNLKSSVLIGLIQGLCLPFRGFSRSGATISTGLILGLEKKYVEDFSFALAVILTPPVVLREALRLLKAQHGAALHGAGAMGLFFPGVAGMFFSFIAGLAALKWLSSWLEGGRWYIFGFYCLGVSAVILLLQAHGL